MEAAAASTEIWVLGWSVVLLSLQVVAQATAARRSRRRPICSARATRSAQSKSIARRPSDRALKNLLETYPAFIAMVVALVVTDKTGGLAAAGAWLWLAARVVYVAALRRRHSRCSGPCLGGLDRRPRADADRPDDLNDADLRTSNDRDRVSLPASLAAASPAWRRLPHRTRDLCRHRAASPNSNSRRGNGRRNGHQQLQDAARQRCRARRHRAVVDGGAPWGMLMHECPEGDVTGRRSCRLHGVAGRHLHVRRPGQYRAAAGAAASGAAEAHPAGSRTVAADVGCQRGGGTCRLAAGCFCIEGLPGMNGYRWLSGRPRS